MGAWARRERLVIRNLKSMKFRDISKDKKTLYQLKENEQVVFFMKNRSANISFELLGEKAEAHVFALYTGTDASKQSLNLVQKHLAPDTVSTALVKSTLDDSATFIYDGAIEITKEAHRSDASQESRALLLSDTARAQARPALEIHAHDVVCHHAATTAPLNPEALYFAQSRGLTPTQARELLVTGFFSDAFERMKTLGIDIFPLQQKMFQSDFSHSSE